MAANVSVTFPKSLSVPLKAALERYDMRVGILKDAQKTIALSRKDGLKSFAGIKVRRTSRARSSKTLREVARELTSRFQGRFKPGPFESTKNKKAIQAYIDEFIAFALKQGGTRRRTVNALQAIVRNPILRGDYGKNTTQTAKVKGFNKFLIDTGQLFQSIKASVISRGR